MKLTYLSIAYILLRLTSTLDERLHAAGRALGHWLRRFGRPGQKERVYLHVCGVPPHMRDPPSTFHAGKSEGAFGHTRCRQECTLIQERDLWLRH